MKKEFIVERNGRSFVLYAGLLDLAHERGLKAITTTLVQIPSELNQNMAICHATVETAQGTFTGLGDASPENVSRMMLPHLIRMAETRAKARALRDAVNVGVTALEELADIDEVGSGEAVEASRPAESPNRSGKQNGSARHGLRALEPVDVVGPEEDLPFDLFERQGRKVVGPRPANGQANGQASGAGSPNGATVRQNEAPATPKQLQTIQRMARAAGKTVPAEGLTRAQASEIISTLIGEMDQQRAS
ncbi:MAG TPA: hypothetical protein VGW38_03965 [Chloroflexota bacterium]|nr:hypothetical protein [Chloroflexota bacterium]